MHEINLTPDVVLAGYANGIFPMGESRNGGVAWYAPDPRAILPIDALHVPKNTRRLLRRRTFHVTSDVAFDRVIEACAGRRETWISTEIEDVYRHLHAIGFAHSVECWEGGELAGGLYGVAIGGAFFGESMFHTKSGASDVALVHLAEHLSTCRFTLLDIQFTNPHLDRYGAVEISRSDFEVILGQALFSGARWQPMSPLHIDQES